MLRWDQDFGSTREHWEQQLIEGRPVPEPFLNLPDIIPEATYYWAAFCDLQSERTYGMSVGPIPISRVRAYADVEGLSEDEWDFFRNVIRDLDNEHLKLMNKKTDTKPAVPIRDTKGMKSLMENFATRQKR